MPRGGESGTETRGGGRTAQAGRPDLDVQIAFAKEAERLGIHGLLVDIGADNPDPLLLCAAIGLATEKVELIVACRSGMWPPTTFAQQLNTLSALLAGRVSVRWTSRTF